MEYLDLVQWPAMLITLVATWLVGSQRKPRREWGFLVFLLSNLLWIVWALHDHAHALIVLQVSLAVLNIRGALKNEKESG